MSIFVINLDRDAERLADCGREFEKADVADLVVRVPAVDASAPDFVAPGYAPHSWQDRWELRRSEQAVFESHRKVWLRIVEEGLAQGIVCEDDILVSPAFPALLQALDTAQFGVVKLDGFSVDRRYGAEQDMKGWPVWEIVEPVPSAACYAVSRVAAERLLADSASYCETLDDFVFQQRAGLRPVQLSPVVAMQRMCSEAPEEPAAAGSLRERRDQSRANKGPVLYRLMKEIRRAVRRMHMIGTRGRRPTRAAGLPPYRN